jgi:hypothetical protein
MLAHEYGWTIEKIIELPRRHVVAFYQACIRRRYEEHQFQASIHGVKLKDYDDQIKKDEPSVILNSEQEQNISKALDGYFAQKAR